ncbi:MAG: hypothetical protein PHF11_07910 [Candidatus Omnitrophica bacterium]|nr:hypothetical protein [Candidatus Omnitrophota bacterium]
MGGYDLEFVLSTQNSNAEFIRNSLTEFGQALEIEQLPKNEAVKGEDFKINISVQDPTIVFDACAQLGRIKSVKVEERS